MDTLSGLLNTTSMYGSGEYHFRVPLPAFPAAVVPADPSPSSEVMERLGRIEAAIDALADRLGRIEAAHPPAAPPAAGPSAPTAGPPAGGAAAAEIEAWPAR